MHSACVTRWRAYSNPNPNPNPNPSPNPSPKPNQVRKDSSEIAEANVQMHVAALGVRLHRVAYAWKYPETQCVAPARSQT